jgi:hypothetical protein
MIVRQRYFKTKQLRPFHNDRWLIVHQFLSEQSKARTLPSTAHNVITLDCRQKQPPEPSFLEPYHFGLFHQTIDESNLRHFVVLEMHDRKCSLLVTFSKPDDRDHFRKHGRHAFNSPLTVYLFKSRECENRHSILSHCNDFGLHEVVSATTYHPHLTPNAECSSAGF